MLLNLLTDLLIQLVDGFLQARAQGQQCLRLQRVLNSGSQAHPLMTVT
jgi:hypothetical protein